MNEPTPFVEFLAFLIMFGWFACPVAFAYCVWKALFGKIREDD